MNALIGAQESASVNDDMNSNGSGMIGESKPKGAVLLSDGRIIIGRVGAPPQQEATSSKFYFWVPPEVLIEKTQLVVCESDIANQTYKFYAIVDEVRRRSRQHNMGGEVDESDNDLTYVPPFANEGYTYAEASILRVEPSVLTSPLERSYVVLAGPDDARLAYEADEIDRPLEVGLVKNGGTQLAGPGVIDLDYLLGANGGHMNVNGAAGRGTKSSFLMWTVWMLLHKAREQQASRPSDAKRLRVVPIVLNVKNFDLFHIDRPNQDFDREKHMSTWHELGIDDPKPFQEASFLAPQQRTNSLAVNTGRTKNVSPYSWSLSDVISRDLFRYLFAEVDTNDPNFGVLVLDIEQMLTHERVNDDGVAQRSLRLDHLPKNTFQGLLDWVNAQMALSDDKRVLRNHHTSTWKKLNRRLLKLVYEGGGVLRRDDENGHPLDVVRADTSDPIVVDLASLAGRPELQRFVVATIFRQLVEARTGTNMIGGLIYLVVLDELNRFAPRGAGDAITELIETVAAEMRSQGIILLGAQQQASKVSERVIENAAIRVLGMTGPLELGSAVWRFLSDAARRKASSLSLDEKLVIQDNFREPMHVRVPFPVWAMNPREAGSDPDSTPAAADFIDA